MALPKGIFESFEENPGTPLDLNEGTPMLDRLDPNSPMAKLLANSKKIMGAKAMEIPEPNVIAEKDYGNEYGGFVKQTAEKRQPINEQFYDERDEKEFQTPSIEELLKKVKGVKPRLVEQKPVEQQYMQQQYNSSSVPSVGIDYGLLNTMIKGAVFEAMQSVKGQLLNENVNNTNKEAVYMTIGNSIKFVDKKGNVYEGKLKLIGNTNN